MAAAADNQHDGTLAGIEENLRGASLEYLHVQAGGRLVAEDGLDGVSRDILHVPARIPVRRYGRPSVRRRVLPGGDEFKPRAEHRGEMGTPSQRLLRRAGSVHAD